MQKNYTRVVAITGSSSGIGEATARRFVAKGFGVIGNGRNVTKLRAVETALGAAFRGVEGDAADVHVLDRMFEFAVQFFGKAPDIVVVNAGRGLGGSVQDADMKSFGELIRTNLTGGFALMQKATREMLRVVEGSSSDGTNDIVVIGSIVGRHISPFSAAYGASKFGLHALVEALRREVASRGIRVSLVEPGIVLSGFQSAAGYSEDFVKSLDEEFGPLLTSDDVARTIDFIVSQPPHVHVGDIVIRPTRQVYP